MGKGGKCDERKKKRRKKERKMKKKKKEMASFGERAKEK